MQQHVNSSDPQWSNPATPGGSQTPRKRVLRQQNSAISTDGLSDVALSDGDSPSGSRVHANGHVSPAGLPLAGQNPAKGVSCIYSWLVTFCMWIWCFFTCQPHFLSTFSTECPCSECALCCHECLSRLMVSCCMGVACHALKCISRQQGLTSGRGALSFTVFPLMWTNLLHMIRCQRGLPI